MKSYKKVAFVIPAYNEGAVINGVINSLNAELKKEPFSYKIIVVDDGSKDDTAKIASSAGAHVIKHILNTGSGGATATGLSYAQQNSFDIAITLDADGQHDPKDAIRGLREINKRKCDLLIGSRLMDSSGMSNVKILGNKGLSFITYILFGINVTDSQSGLRLYSKKALDTLKWKTSGYEFCSEMLWRAKQLKLDIQEYPIKAIYTKYSSAKGQNNWNAINIIKSLLKRRIVEIFGE
ncbi:glycosyltransferase family 2 protein [bacterium]|nr:glycosyltransferase family 2 protein [bacterium]NBX98014.1 glycosyltransferase family 2 protein [bacterium]NDC94262.1 glycosyltransferase family 2 protein [bacterium]NDD84744.1 glycosyltransferase family 2 protein [bacterium]NDG30175.1 glycosyltransferase family 2 protein [bacterium]